MGKYPIFVVNQLSHGPILVLEHFNISSFLSFFLYLYICLYIYNYIYHIILYTYPIHILYSYTILYSIHLLYYTILYTIQVASHPCHYTWRLQFVCRPIDRPFSNSCSLFVDKPCSSSLPSPQSG